MKTTDTTPTRKCQHCDQPIRSSSEPGIWWEHVAPYDAERPHYCFREWLDEDGPNSEETQATPAECPGCGMQLEHAPGCPDALEAKARAQEAEAQASWDRSDTDGFLSQWANGLNAEKNHLAAKLARRGNVSEFTGLFTLDGQRVRAKLIDGKYGTCWAFCDADDKFTGKFVTAYPARAATMGKKGYVEADELAPAKADLLGSNACTTHAQIVRTDKGYPDDAVPEGV